MSIVNAIPLQWKLIIRQSTQHIASYISDTIYLKMGNSDEVALSEVSSKKLYEAFRNKKQVPPAAQPYQVTPSSRHITGTLLFY